MNEFYTPPLKPDEILHYGMPRRSGRYPWGSGDRPYQDTEQKYGSSLFRNAEKRNLDKFGKDREHNILYIDGLSGSGKSTLALFLKKPTDQVIHLDSYFEISNLKDARKNRNSDFDSFLNKNGFDLRNLENGSLFKNNIKEYFKYVDEFVKLTEEYGKKQYDIGRNVIMEGVQVGDETLYLDKNFYNDKPYIRLTTDERTSRYRAKERDLKHSHDSEVKFKMNEFYYLVHGGPGSGRYPWGSGDRPYQRLEKSKRRSGITGYIKSRKEKKIEEQRQKIKAEEERKTTEENERRRRLEANKEKVLREGTPLEIMKYKGMLSNEELSNVVERFRLETKVNEYAKNNMKTNLDRLKDLQGYTNVGSQIAKDGISIWNSFAAIYNATSSGKDNPLSFIKTGDSGKKK